jgi:ribosomal protein S18 acetylase RimI-like enzyme
LKPDICLAKKEDLPALIELDKICIKEEKFNKDQWKYFLLKAKSLVFIASIEGKIIGSIVILLRKHIANARIYILNVHPEFRREGVGSLLMEATLIFLGERGYKKVTIETGINNEAAINLYISKGFLVDKILEKYYRNGMGAKHLMLMLEDRPTKKMKKNISDE